MPTPFRPATRPPSGRLQITDNVGRPEGLTCSSCTSANTCRWIIMSVHELVKTAADLSFSRRWTTVFQSTAEPLAVDIHRLR